ncbi:class I SAM-dependent RNA methyltransferase [Sphingomonas carotinifaciens]|uniref:23S rRNA m(5)U-1939 methyltransferase n=1 Tax=Sphingomonas carotinifaciens TaxID=1166323 RepID=A0A1G7I5H1_9SPHN|nr:class I SAM-dependent RNA methyltransferase [Sphingomonas carotinifaciens]MBB4084999.1 23S rRNA (uracil1939-C5)-methyltransferase [Sphingomonas carotinifaciens]MWC44381.1 class I SAM-dependent RNA methyltransferase [Sphingomonas carotinifaciens]SDF07766.1 23S rRNA m(5)U-1939 methyltransferase [Sphingomonas carotinifaciens]
MTDTIIRVAARGDGVTADGRHAAFAAPGDILNADGTLSHGPHHQVPPCRHFPTCGGCQLQHLDDDSYAAFVTDRVASALDGQGLSAPMRVPHVSPPNTRRRATLHAEAKGGRIRLGFSEEKSHAIVDIAECHILRPELFALVTPLRGFLQRLGFKRRCDIHLAMADQGPDITITGFAPEGLDAAEAIIAFCERHKVARLSVDDGMGPETRWEPEPVTITLGGIPVPLPPGAFLQATEDGEATLVAAVGDAVGKAGTVADLFTGLGTFALALPARVYAAEGARDALLSLKAAANGAGRQVFAEHRDLYRRPLTKPELDRFDAIVLDPPRAGARDQAEALAQANVSAIAYVSCNPASFARDAKMLADHGWRIDWVQPVGQFRWSTHVELAARFVR